MASPITTTWQLRARSNSSASRVRAINGVLSLSAMARVNVERQTTRGQRVQFGRAPAVNFRLHSHLSTGPLNSLQLDVVATRGSIVESHHRVHAAVVRDGIVAAARNASIVASWRSCAKPFQLMPFIAAGGDRALGWGDDQLALACASHGGEPEHVTVAKAMLGDVGLEEGDLACGAHDPLAARGARLLREAGLRPTRLHNNCSGKHAAMLARAHLAGWSTHGYERDGHPVQEGCLTSVAEWTGVASDAIDRGIDGCGVVVFNLPIDAMARAYARLAAAIAQESPVPLRIAKAMAARPFLVGGSDRFDTAVIEETAGNVLAKVGAEGVHCAAILDQQIGIAVKVEDGAARAQYPALLEILRHLRAVADPLPARLAEFARPRIRNTRGEVVGEVSLADARTQAAALR
ncbi:MAG: asparaginase [Gemmatimonadaceae bacterium]